MRALRLNSKIVLNYCKAHRSSASTTVTAGTDFAVPFDVNDADTASFHSIVTNNTRFIAPTTGVYRFSAKPRVGVTATTQVEAWLLRTPATGTDVLKHGYQEVQLPNVGYDVTFIVEDELALSAGDYVELHVRSTGTDISLKGGSTELTTMVVDQMASGTSGGGGGGASTPSRLKAGLSVDWTTIPGSNTTKIPLDTQLSAFGTGITFDTTNHKFTVATDGALEVSFTFRFKPPTSYVGGTDYYYIRISKNGVGTRDPFLNGILAAPTGTGSTTNGFHVVLDVTAGDYIELFIGNSGSSNDAQLSSSLNTVLDLVHWPGQKGS